MSSTNTFFRKGLKTAAHCNKREKQVLRFAQDDKSREGRSSASLGDKLRPGASFISLRWQALAGQVLRFARDGTHKCHLQYFGSVLR